MNKKNENKVLRLLKHVESLSEEEQLFFFDQSQFSVRVIRNAFYTAQEIAELGGYTNHKSILQMACKDSSWDTVTLGTNGMRIFGKRAARRHLNPNAKHKPTWLKLVE